MLTFAKYCLFMVKYGVPSLRDQGLGTERRLMNRIKALRLEAKLSQNHLARLADLDRATVSKAEKGGAVSELTLHKMAAALSQQLGQPLNPDELVAG